MSQVSIDGRPLLSARSRGAVKPQSRTAARHRRGAWRRTRPPSNHPCGRDAHHHL